VELETKYNPRKIPFLTVTIDEHTGEVGVATRVEAFVDLIRRKKGMV
jgi:predicted nucleotide-binding protein (sugar kinase/HSP70/actin superfamily)